MKTNEEAGYSPSFYEICLYGGMPWGFSLSGGSEHHSPLTIAKVENGGKAHEGGLEKDDTLLSINEEECLSHALAVSLIQRAGDQITLIIQRGTLDNNTMKMADFYHQDIPEESGKVSLSKQQYIQSWEEKDLEESKGNKYSSSGGVNKRIKKQNSQSNMQRPKSWHNTGIMHSYSSSMDGSPEGSSSGQSHNYVGHDVHDKDSPSVDAYTSELQQRSIEQFQHVSGVTLTADEHDVSPGFVRRRAMNYGHHVNQSHQIGQGYDLQPAITFPQVVTAVHVQNTQSGRMPNGNTSPQQQQVPGVGIANYSMVQMPQKQYASTADVLGEKKVPPPLPTRVDSKNRTQQLSEHHVKSSSWPATKPQATSTDTPTQSSVISPTSLPPVKLSPSQEQVYPQSRGKQPSTGPPYPRHGGRISTTVSSLPDFQLCNAQPVVISEESTTSMEDWFQAPLSPKPTSTWHASNHHSPPSPPTRDIDVVESSREKRGPMYNTSDSLYKDYVACLSEFEKHESTIQSNQDFTEAAPSSSSSVYDSAGENRLSMTAPVRSSPSFSGQIGQTDAQESQRVQRKNSLIGESNERTWKNPNDFSGTAPAPLRTEPYHNNADHVIKDINSESMPDSQPVVGSNHVRQHSELSLTGNAPRNRTPINLTLMAAVDLKGELDETKKGSANSAIDSGNESRTPDMSASQSLSSEDQRKLDQISSGNSILSMLQRDNQKMNFFGGEEFDRKNGPEVASDRAEPVIGQSNGHYRQGSYDPPSRRNNFYSSSLGLSQSTTSLNNTMPELKAKDKSWSNHTRYHSFSGTPEYEVPDISMEMKLPLEQTSIGQHTTVGSNGNTRLSQYDRLPTDSTNVNVATSGDHRHSKSDSDQAQRSPNTRRHKVSDPQLDSTSYRSFRRLEQMDNRLGKQRRSPQSPRSGSNTSWSSHDSSRSFSGDHYSSTSSLASSRGYSEHRQGPHGRYSDVGGTGRESSPRSSPVQGNHVTRSASMSMPVHLSNLHHRSVSYDDHGKSNQLVSSFPDKYNGIPSDGWKKNKQPHVPERSHSMAVMGSKRKVIASTLDISPLASKGQEKLADVGRGSDKKYQGSYRINTSPKSPSIFKFPVESEIVRQDTFQTENASPLRVSVCTTSNEKTEIPPPQEMFKSGLLNDQLPMSPPLPPPPEEVQEFPLDIDLPPPPDFLLQGSRDAIPRERTPLDTKDSKVIAVQRVDPVRVEQNSYQVKVPSPITTRKASSEEDHLNRSDSPHHRKNSPVPYNRATDNRHADEDSGTEKSSLEDREENQSKEDGEQVEVNESDDPLVNRVLSFLSTSQTSQLRKLYPDFRRGKRKPSRPSTKMPNVSSDEKDKYPSRKGSLSPHEGPLSLSLTNYLQISPGRASLLSKARGLQGSGVSCDDEDEEKLRNTKEELIERITRKVEELCNTQQEVKQEIQETEEIGSQLDSTIKESCTEEIQRKYSTYIGDLEKVTKLLLNLSRKLTKVDGILNDLTEDHKENREHFEKMKGNYASRYEDAKNLKHSISQRHEDISSRLSETLSSGDLDDFTYFVGTRCRFLVEAQDIEDKIQLGNEQIQALKTSLEQHETSKNDETDESRDVNGNCNDGHSKPFPS